MPENAKKAKNAQNAKNAKKCPKMPKKISKNAKTKTCEKKKSYDEKKIVLSLYQKKILGISNRFCERSTQIQFSVNQCSNVPIRFEPIISLFNTKSLAYELQQMPFM